MAGYIGYNPWSDASGAIGSGGDALGSAILRGALMKQEQAQRQQQLMIELQKLQMEQQSAKDLNTYRGSEIDLRTKESGRQDQEQAIKNREEAMRQKFGSSMRMEGVGPLPTDYGAPTIAGVGQYNQEKTQADQNEGAAYLSRDPSNALDTILRMQAARAQPVAGNPLIQQMLVTGRGLHNIPPENIAVGPVGGPTVDTGLARPRTTGQFSPHDASTLYSSGIGRDSIDFPTSAMGQALSNIIMHAASQLPGGTNVAPSQPSGPQPGDVVKGYRFKGGDPSKKQNWEKMAQ